jgi:hypothetical protein
MFRNNERTSNRRAADTVVKIEMHGRIGSRQDAWGDAKVAGTLFPSCKLCTATALTSIHRGGRLVDGFLGQYRRTNKINKLQRERRIEYLTSLRYHTSGSSRRSEVNAIHIYFRCLHSPHFTPASAGRSRDVTQHSISARKLVDYFTVRVT